MTIRLGQLASRPVGDRPRAFLLVALTLVGVAGGLLLTSPEPVTRPTPNHGMPIARPSGVVQVTPAAPHSTPPVPAARERQVARRFFTGYLAYLYGHGTAARIDGATAGLRDRLADHPPRISPATRRRHPRIRSLTVNPADETGRRVTATVADGGVRYPIAVTVSRQSDGTLAVSDLLEEK